MTAYKPDMGNSSARPPSRSRAGSASVVGWRRGSRMTGRRLAGSWELADRSTSRHGSNAIAGLRGGGRHELGEASSAVSASWLR